MISRLYLFLFLSFLLLCGAGNCFADTAYDADYNVHRQIEFKNEYTRQEEDLNEGVPEEVLNRAVKYRVECRRSKVRDNIEAYLSTLPELKRISFNTHHSSVYKIEEKVKSAVKVYGYYRPVIKMTFKSKNSSVLYVHVDLGKPVWIKDTHIEVLGEALTDPGFMRVFRENKLKPYTILSHDAYETIKARVMTTALTRGYFDSHFIKSHVYVDPTENSAEVYLVFNSGKRYRFGAVSYTGDTQYVPAIEPVVDIEPSDRFNTERISRVSGNLYDTGYFADAEVHPVLEETEDYEVPINIHLKRKKFNVVETGIGYATDEGVRGNVRWNMPLLNERGDSLIMQLQMSQVKQEFLVRYKIPYRNPLTDYFYLQAQQTHDELNDTKDDVTSFQAHYVTKEHRPWSVDYGFNVQYEDYTQGMEKGNAWTIGPNLRVNFARAFPRVDARVGENYNFRVATSAKNIGADVTFVQLYSSAKWMFSPTRDSRFLMRFEQGVNVGPDAESAPPSYRFFVGGDNSVRGFGYKTVSDRDRTGKLAGGRYMTTGSAEVQIPVIEDLRSAWFIDAGQATNNYKSDNTVVGVGTGIRYVTPIGLIKVDLGFGVSETHIPFHLHFGIGPDI